MKTLIRLYFFSLIIAFLYPLTVFPQNNSAIIINELMINPNNVSSLPPFEYIEIYNNGTEVVDMRTISLHINANQQTLPTYKLSPKQYVIICPQESVNQFMRYGNALALPRWFALNNASATIKLTQEDRTIDEISYRDTWYNSSTKRNGGWSLERINPNLACNINVNWSATNSLTGGTPGKQNTILDDKYIPIFNITDYNIAQNRIELSFNIENFYLSGVEEAVFSLNEGIGNANSIEIINDKIKLTFSKNIDIQKVYNLQINGLKLCNLNLPPIEIKLFEQVNIKQGDIIINEILFNPKEGGVDFVELYNPSNRPINLQGFKLENRVITNQFYLLHASQYVAITTNKKIISQHYPNAAIGNLLETNTLPPYTNQQGFVTLYSETNVLLDSVYYSSTMHSEHIIDPKGISLERLQSDKNIFYSASTLHGGATPGYKNSISGLDIPENNVFLNSRTLSPDGDGFEDELEIIYELTQPNYILNLEIYNEKGQLLRKLAHQNLAGTHGKVIWDGRDNTGNRCPRGHYICFIRIFNHNGETQNFKQPFVLINSLTRH